MRHSILLLALLLAAATDNRAAAQDTLRYYDFNVVVDYRHASFLDDYTFVFHGSPYTDPDFQPNRLYRIRYTYTSPSLHSRVPIDTVGFYLEPQQRDALFRLTSQLFALADTENISDRRVPMPPVLNHGLQPYVTFDLRLRGDLYTRSIRNPGDHPFSRLNDFLDAIASRE